MGGPCGENEGNLQVGWWKTERTNTGSKSSARLFNPLSLFGGKRDKSVNSVTLETVDKAVVQPAFMDIWRKEYVNTDENKSKMTVIPRSALYVLEKNGFGVFQRVYITRNFDSKDPINGAARDNYDSEFINLDDKNIFSSILEEEKIKNELAARFSRIEDIPAWERGENPAGTVSFVTPPTGRSLVLFDSVCLPHEVMLTMKGNRLALAGWMHESQQDVPKWFHLSS